MRAPLFSFRRRHAGNVENYRNRADGLYEVCREMLAGSTQASTGSLQCGEAAAGCQCGIGKRAASVATNVEMSSWQLMLMKNRAASHFTPKLQAVRRMKPSRGT